MASLLLIVALLDTSTFSVNYPNYQYPGRFSRARAIDFRNMRWHSDFTGRDEDVVLKKGEYQQRFEVGYEAASLLAIHYLQSKVIDHEYVLVLYEWDAAGGSSSQEGIAQVYDLQRGKLKVVEEIDWDIHSQAGRPYAISKDEGLIIRADHYMEGDAHCCISATDVVTFRWNGSRFTRASVRTERKAIQ